jgi:hypothetical protein
VAKKSQKTGKSDRLSLICNQSLGVSGTFGMGVNVSGSFSDSKLSSDYASVQEQRGIRAGAGGLRSRTVWPRPGD